MTNYGKTETALRRYRNANDVAKGILQKAAGKFYNEVGKNLFTVELHEDSEELMIKTEMGIWSVWYRIERTEHEIDSSNQDVYITTFYLDNWQNDFEIDEDTGDYSCESTELFKMGNYDTTVRPSDKNDKVPSGPSSEDSAPLFILNKFIDQFCKEFKL